MAYTFDERTVSDLHKDARGFRPSAWWWDSWRIADMDAKQTIWDNLLNELEAEMARARSAEEAAASAFEVRLRDVIDLGAGNEETALRWILEGEAFDEIDLCYGGSYACFHFGLPYSMAPRFEKVMKELEEKVRA